VDYDLGVWSPCSLSGHEALFLPVYGQLVCDPKTTNRNWKVEQDVRNDPQLQITVLFIQIS
jgi:hypothetical protein